MLSTDVLSSAQAVLSGRPALIMMIAISTPLIATQIGRQGPFSERHSMEIRNALCVALIMVPTVAGCFIHGDRVDVEKTRKELQEARAEIAALKEQVAKLKQPGSSRAAPSQTYLEELDKLAALVQKSALTQEEFDRRKQVILEAQKQPVNTKVGTTSTMEEMDRQLRSLYALYNASTITSSEREAKTAQLLQQPLTTSDLAKDLEMAKSLYNASIIQSSDFQKLKQNLLGLQSNGGH